MTTISRTAGQPVIHGAMGGFFRLLGKWVNGIVTYLARRHAIQTLSELDDRALRDMASTQPDRIGHARHHRSGIRAHHVGRPDDSLLRHGPVERSGRIFSSKASRCPTRAASAPPAAAFAWPSEQVSLTRAGELAGGRRVVGLGSSQASRIVGWTVFPTKLRAASI